MKLPSALLILGLLLSLSVVGVYPNPAARTSVAVLASSQTLRVMTYNIHVGVGMDKKLDLPRIAGVINAQHPDLVGLQEVDRGVTRTQRIDEIAELAKLTRMDYAFAFNLRYQGGQKRIDYIFFFRSTDRTRTKRAWIVDTLASDHVPVVADLEVGVQ